MRTPCQCWWLLAPTHYTERRHAPTVIAAGDDEWGGRHLGSTCITSAAPEVALCPDGTTFSPDATTPEIGRCRHACRAPDAWDPDHVCYTMVSTGTFDWGNNTCGIGECDSHTTRSACEAGEGHWQNDDNLWGEKACSDVQVLTSYFAYVDAATMAAQALGMVGEFCCDGFDAEAFMQCTSDDAPIFVRPKMHHVLTNAPHAAS